MCFCDRVRIVLESWNSDVGFFHLQQIVAVANVLGQVLGFDFDLFLVLLVFWLSNSLALISQLLEVHVFFFLGGLLGLSEEFF
jgi:hypothetical protein